MGLAELATTNFKVIGVEAVNCQQLDYYFELVVIIEVIRVVVIKCWWAYYFKLLVTTEAAIRDQQWLDYYFE